MKMTHYVASLFALVAVGAAFADTSPTPAPSSGAIIDQGGSLRYQDASQAPAATAQPMPPAPVPMDNPPAPTADSASIPAQMAPNTTPGMSATQPTPAAQ